MKTLGPCDVRSLEADERYPLLGPVLHRVDRTSLLAHSFDHLLTEVEASKKTE
jgi:hypothetical protein